MGQVPHSHFRLFDGVHKLQMAFKTRTPAALCVATGVCVYVQSVLGIHFIMSTLIAGLLLKFNG